MDPYSTKKTPLQAVKSSFFDFLKLFSGKKKESSAASSSTNSSQSEVSKPQVQTETQTVAPTVSSRRFNFTLPTLSMDTRTEKALIATAVIFALLIALAVVARVFFGFKIEDAFVNPSPSPTATPATPAPVLSRYATDSAVLKIENDINSLEEALKNLQIEEGNLKPRDLDFTITFK